MITSEEQAEQLLAKFAADLARARLENRRLRAKVEAKHGYHRTTAPRILREAKDTALRLMVAATVGEPISREELRAAGISRIKRYWAIGLLRYSRIMEHNSTRFIVDDFATAERRLECKFEELTSCPNALEKLRLYLPKQMRNTYRGLAR